MVVMHVQANVAIVVVDVEVLVVIVIAARQQFWFLDFFFFFIGFLDGVVSVFCCILGNKSVGGFNLK